MKKILLVSDTWTPQVNGVVTTWKNVINHAEKRNIEFEIIHPYMFRNFAWPFYKEIGIPVVSYKTIKKRIERINPDFIHVATEGILGWHTRKFCNSKNIPFTTTYHTKFPEFLKSLYSIPESFTYKIEKIFHSSAANILVNTPTMKKDLTSRGFQNLIEWTRGVDRDIFNPSKDMVLKKELDPSKRKKIIIYVGRVSKEKNLYEFCKISEKKDDYQLVIVGDGPIKEKLEKSFPKIIFVGYKFGEELAKYYSTADCCVFPSISDTFGNTIIESMACGTPVAAFPVNGPVDIIKKSISGYCDSDLIFAIEKSLKCEEQDVIKSVDKYNWDRCVEILLESLKSSK